MTLTKKLLLGAAIVGMPFAMNANVAHAADATGNATAEIVAAITLVETTPMDFAEIVTDNAADDVTLSPAGAITNTGGSTFQGTPVAGLFDATGNANAAATITFSSGDQLTGPGAAMDLDTFTHDAGGTPAFDGAGALSFNVGATLGVNATQTAGTYTGTYTVSVNYQ